VSLQSFQHLEGDDSLSLGIDLDRYIDEVQHDRSVMIGQGGKGREAEEGKMRRKTVSLCACCFHYLKVPSVYTLEQSTPYSEKFTHTRTHATCFTLTNPCTHAHTTVRHSCLDRGRPPLPRCIDFPLASSLARWTTLPYCSKRFL
jgi:hypothetical protein